MTTQTLKQHMVEKLASAGLLQDVDLEKSEFSELPRFFETSHFFMRLIVHSGASLPRSREIAARMKQNLQSQGIELDYLVQAQSTAQPSGRMAMGAARA